MAQCMEAEVEREAMQTSTDLFDRDSGAEQDQESSDERTGVSLANPSWTTIAGVILVGAGLILLYFYSVAAVQSSLSIFRM